MHIRIYLFAFPSISTRTDSNSSVVYNRKRIKQNNNKKKHDENKRGLRGDSFAKRVFLCISLFSRNLEKTSSYDVASSFRTNTDRNKRTKAKWQCRFEFIFHFHILCLISTEFSCKWQIGIVFDFLSLFYSRNRDFSDFEELNLFLCLPSFAQYHFKGDF